MRRLLVRMLARFTPGRGTRRAERANAPAAPLNAQPPAPSAWFRPVAQPTYDVYAVRRFYLAHEQASDTLTLPVVEVSR